MKKKNKIVHFLLILPILILFLVIGSVAAYAAMMMNDEKANLFQIGNLQTKVKEVFTEPTAIKPDEKVVKKVAVENTGTVNQFIRVMLHPEIHLESLGSIRLLPSKIGEEIFLDLNSTEWKLGEDGYYYYLKSLRPGESNVTKDLFTEVKLKNDLGLEYHNAFISLLIKVEAINCAQYAYREAWWQGAAPSSGALQTIDKELAKQAE